MTPSLFDHTDCHVAMMAPTTCKHGFVETSRVGCSQCARERQDVADLALISRIWHLESNPHTRVGY